MKIKYANVDFTPKDIDEERKSLRAVFSTGDVDRHGEIVDQKSWILKDYLKNPVVLFSHDHSQPPVGKVIGLGYNESGDLEGEIQFAAKEYPFANILWNLYKGGFMKAFSVGFSAGSAEVEDEQVILKDNTLYEISTVSVPANALALAKSKGLDVSPLEEKYIEMEKEIDEETEEPEDEEKEVDEKGCPCNDNKEEEIADETAEEPVVEEEVEEKVADNSQVIEVADVLIDSIKAGKVLSKKNRTAVEEAKAALERVLEADKPKEIEEPEEEEKEEEPEEEKAELSTEVTIPKIDVVAKRVLKNKKKGISKRKVNKAIRELLKAKKQGK
jgi:HK97 family phage prohead protease